MVQWAQLTQPFSRPSWVYVEIDDPIAYLERAEQLGATVVLPTTHIAGAEVTVGWLRDPQGNIVGVVKNDETTQ